MRATPHLDRLRRTKFFGELCRKAVQKPRNFLNSYFIGKDMKIVHTHTYKKMIWYLNVTIILLCPNELHSFVCGFKRRIDRLNFQWLDNRWRRRKSKSGFKQRERRLNRENIIMHTQSFSVCSWSSITVHWHREYISLWKELGILWLKKSF